MKYLADIVAMLVAFAIVLLLTPPGWIGLVLLWIILRS
jgi:hypothetical protein